MHEGHARSMLINLGSSPTQQPSAAKIAIWEAEAEAWSHRRSQLIENASLQKEQLSEYAAELLQASIDMGINRSPASV